MLGVYSPYQEAVLPSLVSYISIYSKCNSYGMRSTTSSDSLQILGIVGLSFIQQHIYFGFPFELILDSQSRGDHAMQLCQVARRGSSGRCENVCENTTNSSNSYAWFSFKGPSFPSEETTLWSTTSSRSCLDWESRDRLEGESEDRIVDLSGANVSSV